MGTSVATTLCTMAAKQFVTFGVLTVLFTASTARAASRSIGWDTSPESSVTGYVLSYGTKSGVYSVQIDVGNATLRQLTGLTDGMTYYVIVQAYTTTRVMSAPSQELPVPISLVPAPVSITCPAPSTTTTGSAAVVYFAPTVTGGTAPVTTSCSPASGSLFPVGSTAFKCTAVDALKQTASCASVVMVTQAAPAPPVGPLSMTCPVVAPVAETGNSGKAAVQFPNPTVANAIGQVTITCSPKSTTWFPVGTTTVACQATDSERRVASCSMPITVLDRKWQKSGVTAEQPN